MTNPSMNPLTVMERANLLAVTNPDFIFLSAQGMEFDNVLYACILGVLDEESCRVNVWDN